MGVTHCHLKTIMKGSGRYHEKRWHVGTPERKADDGLLRLVHLAVATGASALPASTGPTGKRRARQRACAVWSGGQAAKPSLS